MPTKSVMPTKKGNQALYIVCIIKVSFKTLFVRANTVIKETIVNSPVFLRRCEP